MLKILTHCSKQYQKCLGKAFHSDDFSSGSGRSSGDIFACTSFPIVAHGNIYKEHWTSMTHLMHITLHVFSILDQHSLKPNNNLAHWVLASEERITTCALARQAEATMAEDHTSRHRY
jgi:hypothetical protein